MKRFVLAHVLGEILRLVDLTDIVIPGPCIGQQHVAADSLGCVMGKLLYPEGVLESPGRPLTKNPQELVVGVGQLEEPALSQHSEGQLYLGKQAGDNTA